MIRTVKDSNGRLNLGIASISSDGLVHLRAEDLDYDVFGRQAGFLCRTRIPGQVQDQKGLSGHVANQCRVYSEHAKSQFN